MYEETDSVPVTEVEQLWAMVVMKNDEPVKVFTNAEKAKAFAFDLQKEIRDDWTIVEVVEVDADYTGAL